MTWYVCELAAKGCVVWRHSINLEIVAWIESANTEDAPIDVTATIDITLHTCRCLSLWLFTNFSESHPRNSHLHKWWEQTEHNATGINLPKVRRSITVLLRINEGKKKDYKISLTGKASHSALVLKNAASFKSCAKSVKETRLVSLACTVPDANTLELREFLSAI